MKRAALGGCSRLSNIGAYSARPSAFAYTGSPRRLPTVAGEPIESTMRRMTGRTCTCWRAASLPGGRAGGSREVEEVRALGVVELERVGERVEHAV